MGRGLGRRVRLVLSGVLVGALLPVVPAAAEAESVAMGEEAAAAASDPMVVEEVSPAEDQPPLPAEWVQAASSGEPVEVVSRRTADSRTLVNPDGTLTSELYAGIEFVRETPNPSLPDTGRFERIDVTLVDDGDVVRPVRSAGEVTLSRGGSGRLASAGAAGRSVALSWPGVLPTPVLDGPVATYRSVMRNADLEVEATAGGFKWRLVLHARTAKPFQLDIPLGLVGLSASQTATGQLVLSDAEGNQVVVSEPALMWGADMDPRTGDPVRSAAVTTQLLETPSGQVLRVKPDLAFINDKSVSLPIVIDPNLSVAADTFTQKAYPSSSYGTSTELKSGTYNGGSDIARSFLKFGWDSRLTGAHILDSKLHLWNWHSYSCSARPVLVRRLTGAFSNSTTWSTMPSSTTSGEATLSFAHGYSSSCPDAWGSVDVDAITQAWANGSTNHGVMVRASDETDSYGWKKFISADSGTKRPYMAVTYNSYPNTPSGLSPASGHKTTDLTPALTATYSDPDGGSGTLQFQIARNSDGVLVASGSKTGVTSGSSTSWSPGSNLSSQVTYKWRVRAYDSRDYSAWTAYRTITPDNTAPTAPTISSSTHPTQSVWYQSDDPSLAWSASDPTGIVGYAHKMDKVATTDPGTTVTRTATSITYADLSDGIWYLHLRAKDGAGNWSTTRHFTVRIDGTAPAAPTVTSATHPSQTTYYASDDPSFSWAASDVSGITGYSYTMDRVSTTTPDTTSEGTGTAKTYSNLASGEWWFHVRAKNGSGLWSTTTRHYKVLIDPVAPSGVTVSSTSHPDSEAWYRDGALSASWTAATDSLSGIAGYLVVLDGAPTTAPTTGTLATGTSWSATAPSNGIWYLHVRAKDKAGNVGPTSHYRFNIGVFDAVEAYGLQPFTTWAADVNAPFGNFVESVTDAQVATVGPDLEVTRTYNSRSNLVGAFGRGWTHTYGMYAEADAAGNVLVLYPDGRRAVFLLEADGTFTSPQGFWAQLSRPAGGGFLLTEKDRTSYLLDGSGRLVRVTDPAGRVQELTHDGAGRLATVTDVASGRSLAFTWASGKVTQVQTSGATAGAAPLVWTYAYDGDDLQSVCDPRSTATEPRCVTYTSVDNRITEIVRPLGNRKVTVGYDAAGLVTSTTDGTGATTRFEHPAAGTVNIIDPRGHLVVVNYDPERRTVAERHYGATPQLDANGQVVTDVPTTAYSYDSKGFPEATTDPNGVRVETVHDERGNLLSETCKACGRDGTDETTWFEYDTQDNPVAVRGARSSSAADDTYRTTNTWHVSGELQAQVGPPVDGHPAGLPRFSRTFTTGAEAAVGGGTVPPGLVATETDARGRTTTWSHTAAGDVASESRPGGMVIEYAYDQLGRETSRTERFDGAAAVTASTYDALGNLATETGPPVTNEVTGTVQQLRTEFTYDGNGRVATRTERDIATGATAAPRVTRFGYDDNDREISVEDPQQGTTVRTHDAAGNVATVTDALGRVTRTVYDDRNRPVEVWLDNYDDDPDDTTPPTALRLSRTAYDDGGRVTSVTDAAERTRTFTWDGRGRLLTETLLGYVEVDGTVRDVLLRDQTWDAAGNLVREVVADGLRTTTHAYDAADRLVETTGDPGGLAVTTSLVLDEAGNPTVVRTTDPTGRVEETRTVYDDLGLPQSVTVDNGAADLTTHLAHDPRGLLVSTTGPRGAGPGDPAHTTERRYDITGQLVETVAPPVIVEGDGPAATARPTTGFGYDAFGNATHTVDPRGNTTVTSYDRLDRAVRIQHPTYTRPDGHSLTPEETFAYDAVGNLTSRTTRRGATWTYRFDSRNQVVRETAPPATSGASQAVTTVTYDHVGNVVATVDPTGARTETDHDMLDQPRQVRQLVRDAAGGPTRTLTTVLQHDVAGQLVSITDPTGAVTTHGHDALGRRDRTTDATGQIWTTAHDLAGRVVATTDPLGRRVEHDHDLAGRLLATREVAPDGTVLAATTHTHDAAGNTTATTDPRQVTTRYDYDATGLLTAVAVPVTATTELSYGYGYDAAGNLVRTTDGRGNIWTASWTPWNQPATLVEPATDTTPAIADRTYTTLYDAGGLPEVDQQPGGVTVARTFDALARLTTETGTEGTDTAARSFTYDLAGRRRSYTHPGGTQYETYDDRGLLTMTNGPAGQATFTYDDTGRLVTRTDAAGQATFTWTARGELDVLAEPVTGRSMDHDWDPAGQLDRVVHDDGITQQYGWDDRGLLAYEAWHGSAGEIHAELYTYDPAGNPDTRTVRVDGAVARTEGYHYDLAGRLAGWDRPDGTRVDYGWDANSNRTADHRGTYTYDQRNRLVQSPDGTHDWTARGTLAQVTGPAGTATWTFDPLGRAVAHQPATGSAVAMTYDALDRIATRNTTPFAYSGPALDPTSDGTETYGRGPAGDILAVDGPAGPQRVITDRHGDVVAAIDSAGVLTGVRPYDPFGQPTGTTGTVATALGFQGDWTDPTSGEVWQGARWYQPAWATFTARDTVAGELSTPMSLNRYTYAFGSPLRFFDPDGRYGFDGGYSTSKASYSNYAKQNANAAKAKAKSTHHRTVAAKPKLKHEYEPARAKQAKATIARTKSTPKTVKATKPAKPRVANTIRANPVRRPAAAAPRRNSDACVDAAAQRGHPASSCSNPAYRQLALDIKASNCSGYWCGFSARETALDAGRGFSNFSAGFVDHTVIGAVNILPGVEVGAIGPLYNDPNYLHSYDVGTYTGIATDVIGLAKAAPAIIRSVPRAYRSASDALSGVRTALASGRGRAPRAPVGGAGPVRVGQQGLEQLGFVQSTTRINLPGGGYRVPDVLDDAARVIGEVKNVQSLSYTAQLRDYVAYSQARPGWRFDLYVRESTRLTGPLQDAVDAGWIRLDRALQ